MILQFCVAEHHQLKWMTCGQFVIEACAEELGILAEVMCECQRYLLSFQTFFILSVNIRTI
jgi:hypothetical protein